MTQIIDVLKSVAPILGNAIKSGQLFRPHCELTEPDILCEYDSSLQIPKIEKLV
jgi:hypothetical protein